MSRSQVRRPWPAIVFRVIVDIVIVNTALGLALAVDYLWRQGRADAIEGPLWNWIEGKAWSFVLLSLVCVLFFSGFGFYSRNRRYRARYKALAVTEAVLFAFAFFSAISYAFRSYSESVPATALALAATLTLGLCLLARLQGTLISHIFDLGTKDEPESVNSNHVTEPATRKVLVIGGAGYIGSALVPHLLARDVDVCIFDTFGFGRQAVSDWESDPRVTMVQGDFRRVDELVQVMQNCFAVVHLGGIVGDPACAVDPELTVEVNLSSSRLVAEVARAHGIQRFIFASSCSVYGASDQVLDERSTLNPVSLYARSKIAMERVLRELTTDSFRPTILRFGTIFGLSGRTRFDLVANLLTAKAVKNGLITVQGPSQWRPFVHVSDAARAVALAVDAPLDVVGANTYNVGGNSLNMTLGDLGARIKELVPGSAIVESPTEGDARNYRVRFNKISAQLDFQTEWTIDMGIRQVLDFLKENAEVDFESVQFSNIKFMQAELENGSAVSLRRSDIAFLDDTSGY